MAGAVLPVFSWPDYGFAFNDVNFSDRVLRIEILPDLPGSEPEPDGNNRKRRRDDQLSNANATSLEDDGPSTSMEYLPVEVRTVHISSPILAAKSPFFYKLFSNGMMESEQRHATLRIHVSEEAAVMDLLNFIYSNTLPRTTPTALLDVLMAADKFEVASCVTYCSQLLCSLPMTKESALLYLDLPSTVLMADTVQQLTNAAKQFLAASFKDLSKNRKEVMKLPLAGIEAVLSSDDLQVDSEDIIFAIVVLWARLNYPKLDERREILRKLLLGVVRFPFLSWICLKKVLTCVDIDPEFASKVVLEALFVKAEAPYRQPSLLAKEAYATLHRFVERSYKLPAVKVVKFESPWKLCVVYLHLKREECAQLFPSSHIYSQSFGFGGEKFFFSGICQLYDNSSSQCFTLSLGVQEKGSVSFTVDYKFAVRKKPSADFISMSKGKQVFMGENTEKAFSYLNVLTSTWTSFMADDSPYFINGVFHVRAELMIKN